MKRLRYGPKGREKPGLLDKDAVGVEQQAKALDLFAKLVKLPPRPHDVEDADPELVDQRGVVRDGDHRAGNGNVRGP